MHGRKEQREHKNYFIHTQERNETTNRIHVRLSFFSIFCEFHKQNELINNN